MGSGPSYPYLDLEQAVVSAEKMYQYTKKAPVPVNALVVDAWGSTPKSSRGEKVLGAMRAYGLVEDVPSDKGKLVKLTTRAIVILLGEHHSGERLDALREASLAPKWYRSCWDTWGADMPASMRSNLLIHHGFVGTTVDNFLRNYKRTLEYAGLLKSSSIQQADEDSRLSSEQIAIDDSLQVGPLVETAINAFTSNRVGLHPSSIEGEKGAVPDDPYDQSFHDKIFDIPQVRFQQIDDDSKVKQYQFTTPEWAILVQHSKDMDTGSYQNLKDLAAIVIRQIERSLLP